MATPYEELEEHIKKAEETHGALLESVSIISDYYTDILNKDKKDVKDQYIEDILVLVSSSQSGKIQNIMER